MTDTDFTFLLTAVNAKYIHTNPALYSLKAYAGDRYAPHIRIAEYTINERLEDILERIVMQHPSVIGLSCYIWNMQMIEMLLRELPKVLPDTQIWLGGPEVSFDAPERLIKFPCLTGIMVGEGEATFRELMAYYLGDREETQAGSLSQIPGLCLPDGYTAPREALDLSKIPFLYDDLQHFNGRIVYYESSRGCPYSCSYCLSSIDKKVRLRDIDLVGHELQRFLDQRIPQVKFVDRTFNCNRMHTRRIWQYLLDHDNGITNFHFEIAADRLNDEEIALLGRMRPGLVQLEIGVQSVNLRTIREIRRIMDVETVARVTAKIREKRNVHQHLDLIVGLPEEDYESFGRSFDRVYAMAPDQLQMGFLKLLKGSYMHAHAVEYGIVTTDAAPYEVLYTNWLSYEEVRRLKRIEQMVEIFYNSHQYDHVLPYLVGHFPGPFAFFEHLAEEYQDQGYLVNTPARSARYQILHDFARRFVADPELLKELLVYDMYLREKLKSRPVFASGFTPEQRASVRQFYEQEAKTHQYLPEYSGMDAAQLGRQSHAEHFRYPVWDSGQIVNQVKTSSVLQTEEGFWVLFNYRRRDPLTYEALTTVLTQLA